MKDPLKIYLLPAHPLNPTNFRTGQLGVGSVGLDFFFFYFGTSLMILKKGSRYILLKIDSMSQAQHVSVAL